MRVSIQVVKLSKRIQALYEAVARGEVVNLIKGADKAVVCLASPTALAAGGEHVSISVAEFLGWSQAFAGFASAGRTIRVTGGVVEFVLSAPQSGSPIKGLKAVADYQPSSPVVVCPEVLAPKPVDGEAVLKALTEVVVAQLGKGESRRGPGRPRKMKRAA